MDKVFGSALRTDVLVTIGRLGSTYVSEIARILARRPIEIQRAVASLEAAGVVVSRRMGTVRAVELNKHLPEYGELVNFLLRMSERPIYTERWKALRRRPRAIGKAV